VTGVLFGITSVTIAVMAVAPNLELFQKVRVVHLSLLLFLALGAGYMFAFGVLNKQPGSRIMFGGMLIFLATGINDFLLAVGQINSVVTMVGGIFVFVSAMLFVTGDFSNTFWKTNAWWAPLERSTNIWKTPTPTGRNGG
jgi:hypothetical protein